MEYIDDFVLENVKQMNKHLEEEWQNELFRFLRSQGFKPRKTIKYIKNLNKRFKKEGLELITNIQDLGPKIIEDGTLVYKRNYSFEIIPIEEVM